ncbi:PREDICTED: binding partner of ACD11 1-like isoform X2 [Lupinus angustifolius]|uniref:binding partner of ACD11 1-like isoform X2 n=1 Tax=Lupinus angustifolius TaxID=3871 RepID=UPI00092E550B|nr:PREDICTED: binding partner of ACD11 1-like isoform X2 [Lupinus angustifolius]
MSVPMEPTNQGVEATPHTTTTPNWVISVSDVRTVKVSNVSATTTENDIKEFFSFSGDIRYIEMQRVENTQIAYVTFKESQGADTSIFLTGSNINNVPVTITLVENYQLPPEAPPSPDKKQTSVVVKKAEDVVSTMLAKGYILGKDAVNKAKSFDERHNLTSKASATVASIDDKMGLTGKISVGTTIVSEKVKVVDEKFQVSGKTKSAIAIAEQKASSAGSVIMNNHYVSSGATLVSNAINVVAKAVEDVGIMTKEKVELAEVEKKEIIYSEKKGNVDELAQIQYEKPSVVTPPQVLAKSSDDGKLGII